MATQVRQDYPGKTGLSMQSRATQVNRATQAIKGNLGNPVLIRNAGLSRQSRVTQAIQGYPGNPGLPRQ